MELYSEIEPVNDQIVFEFLDETVSGRFSEKTAAGVLLVEHADKQVKYCRWGRILEKGPKVSNLLNAGDIVLVENLRWTNNFRLSDKDYWVTNEESILATWDDKDNLPSEVA